ncbi:MAG: DNA methyltransferase [Pseudomonadota bacterium]
MFESVTLCDGRVTLYRGDSLELLKAGVLKGFDAIVSDPPYGIGFQHGGGGVGGNLSHATAREDNLAPIHGDADPFDPRPWVEAAPRSPQKKPGCVGDPRIILWGADHYMQRLPEGGTLLAWDKHVGLGPDDSFVDCEWAWCGRKTKREVFRWLWKGVVAQKGPLDMSPAHIKGGKGHGAARFARVHVSQKPVALMRWCIDKVRPPIGGVVLDPYMGSGSTGVAALSLGYGFIGVEYEQKHFDTAAARIEQAWSQMQGEAA